ncbi:hypothetical protein J1C56_04125 [Aminobacter anthyllidis]|uniref:Transposase n=1 Tax=Aminobacter anthyllidis TaxID=1035067 RepID=A0A9X1D4C2_9HYPH|nr:hypothetical protein [Aminobacter anthyllidis]
MLRYERQRPGELIHVDIKALGRIDGVGHRITGQHRARGIGYEHLHVAIDDASRLAYVELLPSLAGKMPPVSSTGHWPGTPGWAPGVSG